MSKRQQLPGQLGFDALLVDADQTNNARQFAKETSHLPANMEEALDFFRLSLIPRHNTAMLQGDEKAALALREEAHRRSRRTPMFASTRR